MIATPLTTQILDKHNIKGKSLLGVAPSYHTLMQIRVHVRNCCGYEVYGITFDARDTAFSYLVYVDKRLTKLELIELRAYVQGVIDANP